MLRGTPLPTTATTAAAAKDVEADEGPEIPALVHAAGYGDWPRKLWPTKAMMTALNRATKGDKCSSVPWADLKAAPWYDPTWSKGEVDPDDDHLRALGQQAEDLGFAGFSTKLVARQAFTAFTALKAARTRIRYAQWSAAMARIMHAMAVHRSLGPAGLSVATNYLAILAKLAAERGPDFAIAYDRDLRKHIQAETVPVAEVATHLRTLDDARAAAMQRTRDHNHDRTGCTRCLG